MLPPGRNKVLGWIKQGGGPPAGLVFATYALRALHAWMELESIMLSEISQAVKDKYHMISPISGTDQQNKQASKI